MECGMVPGVRVQPLDADTDPVADRPISAAGDRLTCRLTGAPLDHVFVDLGMSPLANAYLPETALTEMEPFYPLKAYVSSESLLVQLPATVDAAHIFGDYAYFSSFSDSWLQHARDYVDQVTDRFRLGPSSHVVEIASNDGYLLQWFLPKGIP